MQGTADAQLPLATAEPRPRRWSALIFFGFALLIVAVTVLAGLYNPDRHELGFWLRALFFFGPLLVWAAWIGRRLNHGAGVVAAYSFLGCLSALVLIGLLMSLAPPYPETKPFPGMRIMLAARAIAGLYVLLAWSVVGWESFHRSART